MSFVLQPSNGDQGRRVLLERVVSDPGGPGGGVGGGGLIAPGGGTVYPAEPVLYAGVPGPQGSYEEVVIWWARSVLGTSEALGNQRGCTEGDSIVLVARLSKALPVAFSLPLYAYAGTEVSVNLGGDPADLTFDPYLHFAPGQIEASVLVQTSSVTPVAGYTRREYRIGIDTVTNPEIELGLGQPAVNIVASPSYQYVFHLGVYDDTLTGNPVWSWVGVAATGQPPVAEGLGSLFVPIGLSEPAVDELTFAISITPGTAVAGVDYTLVTTEVVFEIGDVEKLVEIQILENAVYNPATPLTCVVVASKSSGTATTDSGSVTQWELSIDDNDAPSTVNWLQSVLQIQENGPAVTLYLQVLGPLATTMSGVTVEVSGSATLGVDYNLTWAQPATPGFVRIPPQTSVVPALTLQALTDAFNNENETVLLTITSAVAPYTVGVDEATVTIIDEVSTLPTEASVSLGTGLSTNMIQGLVAVTPPSTTLPVFMMDGKRCQSVGFERDGDGNWISAYVYGLVERDTFSVPQNGAGLEIEVADGTETVPASAFIDDIAVTYRLVPSGTGGTNFERELSNGIDGNWTSASAALGWDQVGADIVRETLHTGWLRDENYSGSDLGVQFGTGDAPETRCGMVEVVNQRVQGLDLVIVSGRLHFGTIDYDEDVLDLGTDTKTAAGKVYFRSFECEIPSGWTPVIVDAHPNMAVASQILTFHPDRSGAAFSGAADEDEDYVMAPGQAYEFRYAIVKTSGGNVSATQAQKYLRRQNIATFIGPMGIDRNPIWGDAQDFQINLHSAGVQLGTAASANGWRRAQQVSDSVAGVSDGALLCWTTGVADTEVGFYGARKGWAHPWSLPSLGAQSGEQIDAGHGFVPCAGWWRRADVQRMGLASRLRLAMNDPAIGSTRNGWWWRLAVDGTGAQAGEKVLPTVYASMTDQVLFLPPWFWTGSDSIPSGSQPAHQPYYERGPTTLPWNVFEVEEDSALATLFVTYPNFDMAHISRARNPYVDGWWGCREPMARLGMEGVAAWVSRSYAPVPPALDGNGVPAHPFKIWPLFTCNPRFIMSNLASGYSSRQGNWWLRANAGWIGQAESAWNLEVLRGDAWALLSVMSYYATGTDAERDLIAGNSTLSQGYPWWRTYISLLNHVATDTGFIQRLWGTNPNPSPHNATVFGATDTVTRTGAWPAGNHGWNASLPSSPDCFTGTVGFHHWYFIRALFCWRNQMETGSSIRTAVDRVFEWPRTLFRMARAHTQARGQAVWQKYYPMTAEGDASNPNAIPVVAAAQVLAGATYWRLMGAGDDDINKVLHGLIYSLRVTGQTEFLEIMCSCYDVAPPPNLDLLDNTHWPTTVYDGSGAVDVRALRFMFEYVIRQPGGQSWQEIVGAPGNLKRQLNGVQSWFTPFLAYLQQLGV